MIVGICWPTPGPDGALDTEFLLKVARTKASYLRIDLDHRNLRARDIVAEARGAGFEVLPILDLDDRAPDINLFGQFCADIVRTESFPVVEISNEPMVRERMESRGYAELINAVAPIIRRSAPQTRIMIAGEMMKADRKGPTDHSYFEDVKRRVKPALYDLVAIHPYREPGHPDRTRHGTRRQEQQHWVRKAGKPVWVTEVGWKPDVTPDVQGDYVMRELQINEALGVEATFIYAYGADPGWDFGVFDEAQRPRPAAYRIAQFQTRSRSTPPTETAGVA